MIRAIILAAIFMTTWAVVFGQSAGKKPDKDDLAKKAIVALAREFADALVNRDAVAADRILEEDYMDFSNGIPNTKFLLLRALKELPANYPRPEAINLDDSLNLVRFYDNTAVLRTKITLKYHGSKEDLDKKWKMLLPMFDEYAVTLVAVKRNGNWQIVSTNESVWDFKFQISPQR